MKKLTTLTVLSILMLGIFYSCSDSVDETIQMNPSSQQKRTSITVGWNPIYEYSSLSDWQTNGIPLQVNAVRELYDNMITDATDIYIGVKVTNGKQFITDFAYYDALNDRILEFWTLEDGTGEYEPNSNGQGSILNGQYFGQPCGPGLTNLGLCPLSGDLLYCIGFLEGDFAGDNGGFFPGSNYTFTISTGSLGSTVCGGMSL